MPHWRINSTTRQYILVRHGQTIDFESTAVYIADYKMFFSTQTSTFFGVLSGYMKTKWIVQKMINFDIKLHVGLIFNQNVIDNWNLIPSCSFRNITLW